MCLLALRWCLALSLVSFVTWGSHLDDIGLQESEDQIKGHVHDCSNIESCEDVPARICASNGVTYKSPCSFMTAFCKEQPKVAFKHHGECTAAEKCQGGRDFALKEAQTKHGIFIPTCNSDGTFAPIQCHKFTKFCWCTTPAGINIAGTDVPNGIPNCKNFTDRSTSQPSSTKRTPSKGTSFELPRMFVVEGWVVEGSVAQTKPTNAESNNRRKKNRPRGCQGIRRKEFNRKFLQKTLEEFYRENEKINFAASIEVISRAALEWKFRLLDRITNNSQLNQKEYKGIQKLVKGNMTPKKCARKFPKFCDIDQDKKISLKEWIKCFGNGTDAGMQEKPIKRNNKNRTIGVGPIIKPKPNCTLEQFQAQEIFDGGDNNVYIPQCDKKSRFLPVQCYGLEKKNQWYCFCVNVVTGKMIPNTSVQNDLPECLIPKPWPKCIKIGRKEKFLRNLLLFFSKFARNTIPRKVVSSEVGEKNVLDRVFRFLDKNRNNRLEGKEKKKLRSLLKKQKGLWRCGRKIHKVCDIDYNGKITLDELFTCILPRKDLVIDNSVIVTTTIPRSTSGRIGKNPFEVILKSEQ